MEDQKSKPLQEHSPKFLEMALKTDKHEIPEHPDGYGKNTGECGDTVAMYLSVQDGIIRRVSFYIDGCMNTNACANTVSSMVEGKKVAQAWAVTPEMVIEFLETLQEENHHCAELAVGALYLALSNYQENKREPWKKLYSKGK